MKGAPLTEPSLLSRFRGSLLAGAVGDALGAPVEFVSLTEIQGQYGPDGPENLEAGPYPAGSFTDDTQMTLFVAEGLIRTLNQKRKGAGPADLEIMLNAHWRWLSTQGLSPIGDVDPNLLLSWLTDIPGLNQHRAPGQTCVNSLQSGKLGTRDNPLNDSKGCGGVMRIAPVGLAWSDDPFDFGCRVAALTHGHTTGWLASGCLAQIIHEIVNGADLDTAIERAMTKLARHAGHEETLRALEHAEAFAAMGKGTPEEVEALGGGWIAEEALAISVFCALVAPDLESALRLAVTHSGDSDSTGCITGHILGALHGVEAIPQRWLDQLDLSDVVDTVATDLYRASHDAEARNQDGTYDVKRYPGV
jgi:ADP-ribosyl-[dinitrogen reductase] hydrolase